MLSARRAARIPSALMIAVASVLAASAGCATPQPLVRLTPVESKTSFWVAGRATLVAEKEQIRVATAFDHQDGAMLGLRVEIENGTDEPLEIDPAWISFTRCTTGSKDSCGAPLGVINPERALADLEAQRSIETADAANDESAHTALVILGAIGDVGNAASGHGSISQTASASADASASAVRHDSVKTSLGAQRQLWADVALRRNTLFPGHGVGGEVFIPVNLETRYLWLHVRAGEESFAFPFVQTVIPVTRPTRQ